MNLILFLVAYILFFPMTFINYLVVGKKKGYFLETAKNIDIFANREFRATWNKFLKKENGYKFGVAGETISSALGKNKIKGSLTMAGKVLCWILDLIDNDHCIKSIKNN